MRVTLLGCLYSVLDDVNPFIKNIIQKWNTFNFKKLYEFRGIKLYEFDEYWGTELVDKY